MDRRHLRATMRVTLARHPSETDERMMVRLLAFALQPARRPDDGTLEFAKGLWDPDEPELWHKDLTGQHPALDRCRPARRAPADKGERTRRTRQRLQLQREPADLVERHRAKSRAPQHRRVADARRESPALAELAERSMQLQVTVAGGTVWMTSGDRLGRDHAAAIERVTARVGRRPCARPACDERKSIASAPSDHADAIARPARPCRPSRCSTSGSVHGVTTVRQRPAWFRRTTRSMRRSRLASVR